MRSPNSLSNMTEQLRNQFQDKARRRLAKRATVALVLLLPIAGVAPSRQESFASLAQASLAQIDGQVALRGVRDSVQVIRDRWGVPHIYARNIDDLFFAQGFVQAQDRLWQMEMYRRTYEGTLSEIMGPDFIRHDRLARLVKFRGPWMTANGSTTTLKADASSTPLPLG